MTGPEEPASSGGAAQASLVNADAEVIQFYSEHSGALFNYIRRQGINERDAEDLVTDSFLAVAHQWLRIEGERRPYLFRVARYKLLAAKKQGAKYHLDQELIDELFDEDFTDIVDRRIDLAKAIEKLPDRQREVIHLYYYQYFNVAEIAEIVGCTVEAVRKRMTKARRGLDPFLREDYAREGESE